MKKNNLILGAFLAITVILFSSFGASSASNSPSTEKVEGSTESTVSAGVVTIGSQVWTSTNLNVSTYRNGDIIPEVRDAKAWDTLTTGAWCYYDNDPANGTKYGKLYNWYAVNDPRGLAPNGYHIPTDAEWKKLSAYLGGEKKGKKMKSTSGWYNNGNGTNRSGFSGLPGGYREDHGDSSHFYAIEYYGNWWGSAEGSANLAWGRGLSYYNGDIDRQSFNMIYCTGSSVRCIRD